MSAPEAAPSLLAPPPASLRLLRGFAVDFLTAHDLAACRRVMADDYELSIGGHTLSGRDDSYLPATAAQLAQFPGLCVTVHDVVAGPDAVAMRFTEHGASQRDGGRVAAWGGVTLFRVEGGRLRHGWAEEDYFARKRQLKTGAPDAVRPPGLAPWDAACLPPDPATEAAVSAWLAEPKSLPGAASWEEISSQGPPLAELATLDTVETVELFTAGHRAAVHLACRASYRGGFPDIAAAAGTPVTLRLAALLDVESSRVARAQACVDRLGLHRALLDAQRAPTPAEPA